MQQSVSLEDLTQFFRQTFEYVEDYTYNGLQVEGRCEIKKMMFSVSLSQQLIDEAIKQSCDAIFVHHGFFGKSFLQVTGQLKRRLQALLKNDISLFAYHLPLDAHPTLGHNAQLAQFAGLQITKPVECGFICQNEQKLSVKQICENLNQKLPVKYQIETKSEKSNSIGNSIIHCQTNQTPNKIFICSGGSGSFMDKAIKEKCNLFILGEMKENLIADAIENNMQIIQLGHWRSEQPGIWAIMAEVQKKGIECVYQEIENVV